jgi:hypothetical protein
MNAKELPTTEEPLVPPLQELVFAEARSLLAGRSMNRWDGIVAVGHHCSIRARIGARPDGHLGIRVAFRAFEPELVDWSALPLTVWCEALNVRIMPFEQKLTPEGEADFEIPISTDLSADVVTTLRAPVSLVRQTPEVRTEAARAADTGPIPETLWTTVEGIPHYYECFSDDRCLTACYRELEHTLHFQAKGDWSGYSVAWALGGLGEIERSGVATLQDRGAEEWATDAFDIGVPFPRQLYFEMFPSETEPTDTE